jgi:hypothetical protein
VYFGTAFSLYPWRFRNTMKDIHTFYTALAAPLKEIFSLFVFIPAHAVLAEGRTKYYFQFSS